MSTRAATAADLPAIADIYAHYVMNSVASFELEPPAANEWQTRFANVIAAGLPFLVVERDGWVAGYAYCLPWKARPAYQGTVEDSIYLAPWATGKGAGSELLGALLAACRPAGVREVIAVIADSGDPSSIVLHQKQGFVEAGRLRQVGHKHGRDIDTVLLQCTLA
ncbi:GNAT family N-acetyltransferase [Mycobacterium sp. CBMA 234]|uniref:GNAT family N-acetyltransferase n=1 Tax=Mycolicibacterium sp. CBMA 234 TaxID=1918495 RepID=UPI0012DC217D|nr:GNAT family N-acetyltransferase [Mycolicibacterium sp. CBMA 234]MUL63286.1 GNAT family N-acetyltransferase [Mycolicibacterium sp. CBMA 234]